MNNSIQFARENFVDLYPEMLPLLVQHYHEIAWNIEKIKLDVDVEKYVELDDAGILFCFSVRDKKELVGYAAFMLHSHPHYKSTVFASNDVIFIKKPYRGRRLGDEFITFCSKELTAFGAQVMAIRIKDCLDWSSLAQSAGFESVESTHLKWIGD